MSLGVIGVGIISQLSNFINLLNFIVPLGIPNGLSKITAEQNINDKAILSNYFFNALNIVVLPVIAFSLLIFLSSSFISNQLFDSPDFSNYIRLISLLLPFVVLNSIFEGFLRNLGDINLYVKLNIYANIIGLSIIFVLTYLIGLYGAIVGILSINVFYSLLGIYFTFKLKILSLSNYRFSIDNAVLRKLLKLSLIFLISGGAFQLTLIIIRKMVISQFGLYYNGIYQSTIAISLNYFGFVFLSLSAYSFPVISKLDTSDEINNELNLNLRYINLIIIPLVCFAFINRYMLISILYSKDFLEAQQLYSLQFTGDYFKALSWAIGIWLVPKMKLKYFMILEIILNFNFIFLTYTLLLFFPNNLQCISAGYLITYIIHFLLNYFVTKRSLNFSFSKINLKQFAVNFFLVLPLLLISYFNNIWGYYIVVPFFIVWIFFSVKKDELLKIKKLFI